MKILYISTEAVPDSHGGSVHTWEAARHLAARGHAVILVCPAQDGLPADETAQGIRILRFPMRWAGRSLPALLLLRAPRLARLPCDAVLSRWSALGGADLLLSRLAGAPLVLEINNPHAEEIAQRRGWGPVRAAFFEEASRWLASGADGAVTPNARIAPPGVPVLEIPWGVDTDSFHPRRYVGRAALRKELGLADNPTALFTGTFRRWHGAQEIPAIAERVLKAIPEAIFLLAGDGEMRPTVEEEISRRNLTGCVRLLGALPHARMPDLVAAADVGIAPFTPDENPLFARFGFYYSPLKIFEYMAAGLPTVTFAVPPLDRIVEDGKTGRCAPLGDIAAFAAALAGLLADPATRMRLGETARKKAEREYGWDIHAEKLEGFLKSLIVPLTGSLDASRPGRSR